MTMPEVRDAVIGIVPDEKWTTWWTSARKNPQIVVSGSGAKATYSYSSSAGEAEKTIRRDFERADVKSKLELARKHSTRSKELADAFSSALAAEAGMRLVPGVEISASWRGQAIHVLGLWIDPAARRLRERLDSQADRRRTRMRAGPVRG